MVSASQVSARSAQSPRHAYRAVVLAWAVLLAVGVSDVYAQTTTARVQSAHLWSKSTSLSLGLKYDKPLGADHNQLPGRGEHDMETVRNWLFTGMVGAGVAIPNAGVDNTDLTVVGYAGFMRRTDWWVERVGLATYVHLEPRAIGPALLGTVSGAEIVVGGLWVEGGDFVLALGLDLPLESIRDLFR